MWFLIVIVIGLVTIFKNDPEMGWETLPALLVGILLIAGITFIIDLFKGDTPSREKTEEEMEEEKERGMVGRRESGVLDYWAGTTCSDCKYYDRHRGACDKFLTEDTTSDHTCSWFAQK